MTGWNFDNTYARLPDLFFARQNPTPVRAPKMVLFNRELAEVLGLDAELLGSNEGAAIFAGNVIPDGAEPIAQAYAGHQFGHFTMLGDGRAVLLGEQVAPNKKRYDLQLKGSGQTPFSRRGDGRAALGPMLREYIISEAMHALGIPTTRSLAVVETDEPVFRETPLPGAVLARVASSHIRVGTFEYAAALDDPKALRTLADYTLRRHYPELAEHSSPFLSMLKAVMERQAQLIAKWMQVGFVHGVMNTDNMTLSGETIDYGPCAFMDAYSPVTLFSSIDRNGRYAFGNQPRIAQWNLARLAEALVPLLHDEQEKALTLAKDAVESFPALLEAKFQECMRGKLGLYTEEAGDATLVQDLLSWMEGSEADYTNTFRALTEALPGVSSPGSQSLFQQAGFQEWKGNWHARLKKQAQTIEEAARRMSSFNPAVIPRNHKVEEALAAAESDLSLTRKLLEAVKSPYLDSPAQTGYREPKKSDTPYKTFCGT